MKEREHGTYETLSLEKNFLEVTTGTKLVVCHFFHKDFQKCKTIDGHMSVRTKRNMTNTP